MKPTLEELRAYVDGESDNELSHTIELAIKSDSELKATVDALRASRLPYKEAYLKVGNEPLPESLRAKITNLTSNDYPDDLPQPPQRRWSGLAVLCTALLMSVLGYGIGTSMGTNDKLKNTTQTAEALQNWAEIVASYQSLYVRETVSGTKNGLQQAQLLQAALTSKINAPIHIPDFKSEGFEFIRAQQLGFKEQTLVQLVYLGPDGLPLALCFMPDQGDVTKLAIKKSSDLMTGVWRNSGLRFVLVGDVNADTVARLQAISNIRWLGNKG